MKKNDLDSFVAKMNIIHSYKYDYSKSIYINNFTKIKIICPIHGEFMQTPKNHYRSGCAQCAFDSMKKYNFAERAKIIHNNKFDYSKVRYINQNSKVIIICKIHGEFLQTPKSHLNGTGCKRCWHEKPIYNKKTNECFIETCNKIHNNFYNYKLVNYDGNTKYITIICPVHGEFIQLAKIHIKGGGCPSCSGTKKLDTQIFIKRSNVIHNNKFDYSKTEYVNCTTKVQIICPSHGTFWQVAQDHLGGHGCYKCNKCSSKEENLWLDYCQVPKDRKHRNIYLTINNKKYNVDGYHNNIVYEFYGDFWHGNPLKFKPTLINPANKKTYKELYENTMIRKREIEKAGYKVIYIWENDWIKKKLEI